MNSIPVETLYLLHGVDMNSHRNVTNDDIGITETIEKATGMLTLDRM